MSYDIEKIIDKISHKTDNSEIKWNPYNIGNDTNQYSKTFFSTTPEVIYTKGYRASYQDGYIFLMPSINNEFLLFLQPSIDSLPTLMNPPMGSSFYNWAVEHMYFKIKSSFDNLSDFIVKIIE